MTSPENEVDGVRDGKHRNTVLAWALQKFDTTAGKHFSLLALTIYESKGAESTIIDVSLNVEATHRHSAFYFTKGTDNVKGEIKEA